LPTFRVSIHNKVPYLGNFGYSPIYMLVKKNDKNEVTELFVLDPPMRSENFVS
jgi:hypothetical protein